MSKRARKLFAGILTLAMVLTSITWPEGKKASAAETKLPGSDLVAEAVLTASGNTLDANKNADENGVIQTSSDAKIMNSKYLEIAFTGNLESIEDEDNLFSFQAKDASGDTGATVYVKKKDVVLNKSTNQYVAHVLTSEIKGTLSSPTSVTLSFVKETVVDPEEEATATPDGEATEEPEATGGEASAALDDSAKNIVLTRYNALRDPLTDEEAVTISGASNGTGDGHETLQEFTIKELLAGTDKTYKDVQEAKVTVYAHVTESTNYSRVKVRIGNLPGNSFSNVELVGRNCTTKSSSNSPTYIHLGYRTELGYGKGQGMAGSGNYKFNADKNLKKVGEDNDGIRLTRMTREVNCYIIGIVFNGVISLSLSEPDEDGNVTITEGFDPNTKNIESPELDETDYTEEEWAEITKAERDRIEKERLAMRAGLKSSIDACEAMTAEDYEQDSIDAVQAALTEAKAAYEKEDSDRATYRDARNALETVHAKAVPKMSTDAGKPKAFRILSKDDVIKEMGSGINLGNTMDGGLFNATETSWQAAKTTKAYIKALHDAGFNTVRIPVTWGGYINDDYSIDEKWIGRVQEIVDYCVDQDMYAIINIHHDGAANHDDRGNNTPQCWLDTYADDIESVYAKYSGVWKTIANRFKDYDEHLIFESMNEVTDAHNTAPNEDTEVLNTLNQFFVNTVRATGSNNVKRWLAFTGRFASFSTGTTKPEDSLRSAEANTERLMFAVHIYKGMHNTSRSYGALKEYQTSLSSTVGNVGKLSDEIPIYIGEYGQDQTAQSGTETGMNNVERALDGEFVNAVARFYGACPVVWDQGWGDYSEAIKTATGGSAFIYWNRVTCEPVYKNIIDGMMRGWYVDNAYYNPGSSVGTLMEAIYLSYGHPNTDDIKVSKDPEITEITDFTVSEGDNQNVSTVSMGAGTRTTLTVSVAPEDTRDLVLWSTDDDSVATVSQGMIHAKRSGITTVHAYTQSGSMQKDIKVVVGLSGSETATAITTDKAYYSIERGETATINATLTPADSQDEISYFSSDTSVATVSSSGVITAVGAGVTYIIVTAASGVSTIVRVEVPKSDSSNHVEVALHAYFNSGEVVGAPVDIKGNGEYTATLDLSTLTENEAGITALNNMVSIYLKDENATNPAEIHPTKAQIRYDKVVVDDTELPLKTPEQLLDMWTGNKVEAELADDGTCFKNALKADGFNTNDPINGYDGCVVADSEVSVNDYQVSFRNADLANAQKITVAFTIRGLEFPAEKVKENEATAMTTTDANIIKLAQPGDTQDITLSLTPADTDSKVTVYSTNSSVVAVDSTAKGVDADGKVKVTLTGISKGTATVVAITENMLKVLYAVGVGDVEVSEPTDPTPPGLDGSVVEPSPTPPGGDENPGGDGTGDNDGNGTGDNGTGGSGTATLTVSKKSVIIAAGKTISVNFTASSTPSVKTSSAKVATAKVSGNKVSISVPKKATKGATAKITLTVGAKSEVINVTVQNPAKKIKAAKKTVTVKKKKKVTAKFKVTATNKKKAAADTIKVTSKKKNIAKVVSYSVKKGKATVKIQGVKKGKTTVTLKIGKKSAKVTVKVK